MADPGDVKKVYQFSAGMPNVPLRHEAAKILLKATEHRLKDELETSGDFMKYWNTGEGHPKFRKALAKFLTEEYGDPVSREDLFLTSGASNGLLLAFTLLVDKNSPVFTEEPLYFYAGGIVKDCGMKGVPVQMDEEGMNLDDLESKVKEYKDSWDKNPTSRPYNGMVYLVPTFHNPTGNCYSEDRLRGLVKLARKYNLLLLSEDVYNLLYYTGTAPPKRLFAFDNKSDPDYVGSVISNASFSKYLTPGIRVGWYEAPEKVHDIYMKSAVFQGGGPMNHLGSGFVASAIELGLQQEFIKRLRSIYGNRMSTFIKVLGEHLPKSCSFSKPEGGYFMWITLPNGVDNTCIIEKAQSEYGVRVLEGQLFSQVGAFKNCIRICVAPINDEDIVPGLTALCDCLQKYLP